jgi:hypothetical protein
MDWFSQFWLQVREKFILKLKIKKKKKTLLHSYDGARKL